MNEDLDDREASNSSRSNRGDSDSMDNMTVESGPPMSARSLINFSDSNDQALQN